MSVCVSVCVNACRRECMRERERERDELLGRNYLTEKMDKESPQYSSKRMPNNEQRKTVRQKVRKNRVLDLCNLQSLDNNLLLRPGRINE